ncbi:hypothetical protein SESBI_47577 [Sesbania bispinosa]|nr:hypothetical protein SESBI_47577 [Sesbania bispinosa]
MSTSSLVESQHALAVQAPLKSHKPGKKDRPLCSHCGILGHTIDKCFKIHGYTPGFKNKSKGPNVVAQVSDSSIGTVNQLSAAQCQQLIDMLSSQLTAPSTSNDKPDDQAFSSGIALSIAQSPSSSPY